MFERPLPDYRQRSFEFFTKWTRTQRIRTAGAIPVDALVVDRAEVPVYVQIGEKAMQLRDLKMSDKAIARALGVSDKTVAKATELRTKRVGPTG